MNSEELELSLRTEFESYLKSFLADLRQEVSEFQKNFETEFEKHKTQTDQAVRKLIERFETGVTFDQAFNESVVEHLRLARDEGATITAVAIGEAEKLKEASAPAAEYDKLRDAINDISSKTSQSEILKALVDHASLFAPRGAFFIVKNEHFIGWRAFGEEAGPDEAAVRGIQFPMSLDTVLAEAVSTLCTAAGASGSHSDDRLFLDPLAFGSPDRMYAIPLVARGRGVAVLYADYGGDGIGLTPEALETLVRVAGLTVELAAAAAQPVAVPQPAETASEPVQENVEQAQPAATASEEPAAEDDHAVEETVSTGFETHVQEQEFAEPGTSFAEAPSFAEVSEPDVVQEVVQEEEYAPAEFVAEYHEAAEVAPVEEAVEPVVEETVDEVPATGFSFESNEAAFIEEVVAEPVEGAVEEVPVERFGSEVEETAYFEPVEEAVVEPEPDVQPETAQFETFTQPEAAEPVVEEFPETIEEPEAVYEPAPAAVEFVPQENGVPAAAVTEPLAEVASQQAARTRYRDRNVDLPIEVPEEERRLHNDARRFARLLVSEIKLYNEQKVSEGRESGDLYDRLREAIDRSRDMYDKRVQQPVAEKFDYFHYELVNSLAEGNDVKLGASYPGSRVAA